jgi:carbonic anhydrase
MTGVLALVKAMACSAVSSRETPQDALARLQEGNMRFVRGCPANDRRGAARRKETAEHGQQPFATVLTCSDSRVPPELLFDAGIGDLFVVRVAGNVCNRDEAGSIEYAVEHLETPVCVVLGHTKCGAVTAVVGGARLHGCVATLVHGIKRAVDDVRAQSPGLAGESLVEAVVEANLHCVIADLFEHVPAARKRVDNDQLAVLGAIYDIESGIVRWII